MKKLLVLSIFSVSVFAYTNCSACHNGGYKEKLNTFTPSEIVKIIKEYKVGKRGGMMSNILKNMNDKEIQEVANKYGKK